MSTLAQAVEQVLRLREAGALAAAEELCGRILAQVPEQPEVLHLYGLLAEAQGRTVVAIERIRRAIDAGSANPTHHHNLGLLLLRAESAAEAADCFRRALALKPELADSACSLGVALKAQGKLDEAIDRFRHALRIDPDFAAAHANLGNALFERGAVAEAAASCRAALRIDPGSVEAHFNLGIALKSVGRFEESLNHYREAVRLTPAFAPGWNNLGNLLFELDRFDEAVDAYRHAIGADATYAEAHFNLGTALLEVGELADAIDALRTATHLRPNDARALGNLGAALKRANRMDEAVVAYRAAVGQDADVAANHYGLGNALVELDELDQAADSYRRAAALEPGNWIWQLRGASLCPLVFDDTDQIDHYRATLEATLDRLRERHEPIDPNLLGISGCEPSFNLPFHGRNDRSIKEMYAAVFAGRFPEIDPRFGVGPPSVGMLVADGHEPLFVRQMVGTLDRLRSDRLNVTILCSPAGRRIIEATVRNRAIEYLPLPRRFADAIDAVRAARFDLLYYREIGTDSFNYFMPYFRPAPIQCTTWGIQVTTGIPTMDHYLSSELIEGADAETHYTENLVRFKTLLTYQARRSMPEHPRGRAHFGLAPRDHVYLCAQNLGKFHPDFDPVLGAILRRDPMGKLVITAGKSKRPAQRLWRRFERTLSDVVDRIVLLPPLDRGAYHSLVSGADLMLDPLYFNGVNTTYDGLSMDLPIVTLPWTYQRGRYTYGCYRKMGVLDCVAASIEEYVDIAVRLGTDSDIRTEVGRRIGAASELLFEDETVPTELERFFVETIESARAAR